MLIKCQECGKEVSDKAFSCPNCGCPIDNNEEVLKEINKLDISGNSAISNKKGKSNDENKPATGGCLGLIVFAFICMLMGSCLFDGGNETSESTTTSTTQEITTTEASTEMSEEDFKSSCIEVNYEEIYRNPETYRGKPIKITLDVNEYDTQVLGLLDVYYCSYDGNFVFVSDYRVVKEPTIASGDKVVIYGTGAGMATVTESQRNILGIKTNSEKSQVPNIDMQYVELSE